MSRRHDERERDRGEHRGERERERERDRQRDRERGDRERGDRDRGERDRERDREATPRAGASLSSVRKNEYFVPKEGIDREVITADICRYLGPDALVRPGNYQDPKTGMVRAGYLITAYRNLTTAMIEDLKADSERWDTERRKGGARSSAGGAYISSIIHQSRQHYGPSNKSPSHITPTSTQSPLVGGPSPYDIQSPPQYSSQVSSSGVVYASSPAAAYPVVATQDPFRNGHYYAGADFRVDQSRGVAAAASSGMPRSAVYASPYTTSAPVFQNAPDGRYYGEPPISQGSAYATNPGMYDRAMPGEYRPDPYGEQYMGSSTVYPSSTVYSSSMAPSTSSRDPRETRESKRSRDDDQGRSRHGRHDR